MIRSAVAALSLGCLIAVWIDPDSKGTLIALALGVAVGLFVLVETLRLLWPDSASAADD